MTSTTPSARIGGMIELPSRCNHDSRALSCSSRTSRPAPTAAVSSRSTSACVMTESSRAGMAGYLLTKTEGDFRGEGPDLRMFDRPGTLDVDLPLADHPTGPGGQQHDPLAEAHRLAHVVRDEDDAVARLLPDPGQLVVHHVPGDRVERGERLVHQQYVAVLA